MHGIKHIAEDCNSTGFRVYKNNRLVTWIQRRCRDCKRFLNKEQKVYCSLCSKKRERHSKRKKTEGTRFYKATWTAVYRHANQLNVGDIF
jgi:hypothetical protein